MKKTVFILFLAVAVLTACDLEHSDNGKLDGNWQLTQLDTLSTGGSADMKESNIFWSVEHHLLECKNLHNIEQNVFFRFEHGEGTLRLYHPISDNKFISDSIVTSPVTLRVFGIQHLDETFLIEKLTSSHMMLRNELYRFHFRKY
jgi:hypothetical protein